MKTTRLDLPVMASWMESNGRRLDCNPYLSGGFEARVLLEKLPDNQKQSLQQLTLGGMQGLINPGRIARRWVNDEEHGIPFLSSTDILQADLSTISLISKKAAKQNPKLLIKKDWILITRSGTIGRMVYSRPDMDGMACTEDVLRVIPDRTKIPPGYLYAYLSSRFGVSLITSGTYGSIIQHLEPNHIADLPVPRLGAAIENEAHNLMVEAARLRTEYQTQVRSATHQLFESVGLKDITPVEWHEMGADLGFMHMLNSPASLRSANFNPRFKKLCNSVQTKSWKSLGDICIPGTLHRAGRYKRIDAEDGHGCQLIGQRHLFWLRPEGRSVARFALGDDLFVEAGTTLVAAQGTLGEGELYCRAEFVIEPATSFAYSEHLLRVIANDDVMLKGCLFAFMRSETAFRMLRSISSGSKLQDHHYAFLPHLPVPYPKMKIQEKIHELVMDAYKKRHHSNALEDRAVSLISQAIERT
jgi:hypothetical protein